ncbi:MAG: VPLPA-CTERM sorting domain-containing protein [Rhodobacteraceae bacterium]|nr:VPLPA-CTERM sorting domain-containing protein [Paracoccaceae bacterium]
MSNKFLAAALPALALSLAAGSASAATLAGDTVGVSFDPSFYNNPSVSVGAGIDLTISAFEFDFDAGVNGDELVFNDNGGFFPVGSSLTLYDLDFSGGETLVGFDLSYTSLDNLAYTFTDTSITFTYATSGTGPNFGAAIYGTFLTVPSAVPLPASLPLLIAGLGGLTALRRKRRAS